MDFVVLLKFRSSVSAAEADAGVGRRAAWKYPEGVQVIAEYWPLSSAVQVVSILSADSVEKIMEIVFEWNDVFDIDVYPACSSKPEISESWAVGLYGSRGMTMGCGDAFGGGEILMSPRTS